MAIGSSLTLRIDNPLGTMSEGSLAFLSISTVADASPCGTMVPGWGMDGGPGAVLIGSQPPPWVVGGIAWEGPGTPAPIVIQLPNLPHLIGVRVYAQGLLVDFAAPKIGLARATELVIGS